MKIILTEDQYKEVLNENIIKDTLKDLKINAGIVFTFGAGMGAFMGPVNRLLSGSGFNLESSEVALLIITSVAILLNDISKKELLNKVEDKNLTEPLDGVKDLIKNMIGLKE